VIVDFLRYVYLVERAVSCSQRKGFHKSKRVPVFALLRIRPSLSPLALGCLSVNICIGKQSAKTPSIYLASAERREQESTQRRKYQSLPADSHVIEMPESANGERRPLVTRRLDRKGHRVHNSGEMDCVHRVQVGSVSFNLLPFALLYTVKYVIAFEVHSVIVLHTYIRQWSTNCTVYLNMKHILMQTSIP
jgi:hypothetical protein